MVVSRTSLVWARPGATVSWAPAPPQSPGACNAQLKVRVSFQRCPRCPSLHSRDAALQGQQRGPSPRRLESVCLQILAQNILLNISQDLLKQTATVNKPRARLFLPRRWWFLLEDTSPWRWAQDLRGAP